MFVDIKSMHACARELVSYLLPYNVDEFEKKGIFDYFQVQRSSTIVMQRNPLLVK